MRSLIFVLPLALVACEVEEECAPGGVYNYTAQLTSTNCPGQSQFSPASMRLVTVNLTTGHGLIGCTAGVLHSGCTTSINEVCGFDSRQRVLHTRINWSDGGKTGEGLARLMHNSTPPCEEHFAVRYTK